MSPRPSSICKVVATSFGDIGEAIAIVASAARKTVVIRIFAVFKMGVGWIIPIRRSFLMKKRE